MILGDFNLDIQIRKKGLETTSLKCIDSSEKGHVDNFFYKSQSRRLNLHTNVFISFLKITVVTISEFLVLAITSFRNGHIHLGDSAQCCLL